MQSISGGSAYASFQQFDSVARTKGGEASQRAQELKGSAIPVWINSCSTLRASQSPAAEVSRGLGERTAKQLGESLEQLVDLQQSDAKRAGDLADTLTGKEQGPKEDLTHLGLKLGFALGGPGMDSAAMLRAFTAIAASPLSSEHKSVLLAAVILAKGDPAELSDVEKQVIQSLVEQASGGMNVSPELKHALRQGAADALGLKPQAAVPSAVPYQFPEVQHAPPLPDIPDEPDNPQKYYGMSSNSPAAASNGPLSALVPEPRGRTEKLGFSAADLEAAKKNLKKPPQGSSHPPLAQAPLDKTMNALHAKHAEKLQPYLERWEIAQADAAKQEDPDVKNNEWGE